MEQVGYRVMRTFLRNELTPRLIELEEAISRRPSRWLRPGGTTMKRAA
jgi:hypothetical protein